MIKKCAVIIGVNNVRNTEPLQAAAEGARKFDAWAQDQDYKTTLLTDEQEGSKVTFDQVFEAIDDFINEQYYDLMIVYFSGHGIWKDTLAEHWLLSEAARNPNEAVNIISSAFAAEYCGIPHVVFISDACRTKTGNNALSRVNGGCIFPSEFSEYPSVVDRFNGSRVLKPAYEKPAAGNSAAFGIFTECLLEGLSGQVPGVITLVREGQGHIKVIASQELKGYLELVVPIAAAKVRPDYTQHPDVRVQSRKPRHIARFGDPIPPGSPELFPFNEQAAQPPGPNDLNVNSGYEGIGVLEDPTPYIDRRMLQKLESFPGKFPDQRDHVQGVIDRFRSSFIIDGATDLQVNRQWPAEHMISEGKYAAISIPEDYNKDFILLRLSNGNGVPLTIIPGFIGVVLLKNNHVVNISYHPGPSNYRYHENEQMRPWVMEGRAYIAAAVQLGVFRITGTTADIKDAAGFIRYSKAFDPTLGLYAAYAYAQASDWEQVQSVYDYMKREPEPVLFDVALLNYLGSYRTGVIKKFKHTGGFGPVLTQGWSYLTTDFKKFPRHLEKQSRYLVPGLWTTFTEVGADLAAEKL